MRMINRFLGASVVLFVFSICVTGRIETVRFESKIVGASLPYNVILPAAMKRAAGA